MQIKSLIMIVGLGSFTTTVTGQNIGIGTRATFELNGMVGNTTAIFGSNEKGVGLIGSWPHVDFNAYFNGGHRYMSNGYAVAQYFTANTGEWGFDAYASGTKDAVVTGGKRALTIAANARVAIGSAPDFNAQLTVMKDADKDATAFFAAAQPSAFNYGPTEYTAIRGGANQTRLQLNYYAQNSKIVIGVDGTKVGINSAAPVYPLEMYVPDFAISLMRMGSLNHWIITVSQYYLKLFFRSTTANNTIVQRGVFDFNTGQYSASSDRRMKKNIEPLPPTLDKILQLQPYSYEMKYNNPNHDQTFGLIAQDVKEVFPSLVHATQNANTGYENIKDVHTLNYSGLAPFVIKALQEQQAQLKQLEERTSKLEKQ